MNKERWKWFIGLVFIWLSIFSFIAFYDYAPVGIFSDPSTTYNISIVDGSIDTGTISAEVNSAITGRDDTGFDLPYEFLGIVLMSVVLTLFPCLSGYSLSYRYECGRFASSAIAGILYLVSLRLIFYQFNINETLVSYIGIGLHCLFILILLLFLSSDLTPTISRKNAGLYIDIRGRLAQAALSLGLAIAIGGALTFGAATSSLAFPLATFVGIFFFPLAGIAAIEYYRIYRVEVETRA